MANVYQRFTQGMTPGTKGVLNILLVAGGGLAAYIIYHNYQKNKDLANAKKAADQATGELAALKAQGITPSYADSEFTNFVNALVQAMNGCGTDENAVYAVFDKMKNDADIRMLIASFGVQYYEPCAASQPISYIRWQFDSQAYGGDLATFLNYDLTSSEIAHINSILQTSGINYLF